MGSRVKGKVIDVELRRLFERDGHLVASIVLKESRPKGSPLHSYFEWDDGAAAEAYRLDQARNIIRIAKYVTDSGELESYVHVSARIENVGDAAGGREGYYKTTSLVVQSVDELGRSLNEARLHLRSASRWITELLAAMEQRGADPSESQRVKKVLLALKRVDHQLDSLS